MTPARARRLRAWAGVALAALVGASMPALAVVTYEEASAAVGVQFQFAGEVHDGIVDDHGNGWPAFPEITGGGGCFADFDGDGLDDLYLVTQQFNPENPETEGWIDAVDPTNKLYLNDGDGTFTDGTAVAGVESRRFGYACSAADYDGDGDIDLYVANYGDGRFGGNELYRNEGDGTFTEVGVAAGVDATDACPVEPCWTSSSTWGDYDLDGDLDLYVATYVDSNLTDLIQSPAEHLAQHNWLYRNNADGTFTEVAKEAGVAGERANIPRAAKTWGVAWFDYDLDGDQDLYVANDKVPNDFYVNQGDGTFVERSEAAGVDDVRAGMGLAVGDYDNDGLPDLFFTHFAGEDNGFYRNLGDGTFEDRSGEDGHSSSFHKVGWGTNFIDFDRDMDLDIFVGNGHTYWGASEPGEIDGYNQTAQLFRNDPEADPQGAGDREWVDVTADSGAGVTLERVTRGTPAADYDLDGDTDIVRVNNGNQTADFLRASGVENHWIYVQLRQPGLNPRAVGARVLLEAGGVTQYREVQAGSGFQSQNTANLEFGLGENPQADRVTVQWPGGGTTVVTGLPADRVVRIDRSTGTFLTDTLSPLTDAVLVGTEGREAWFRSAVTATLTAADRAVGTASGVASTQLSVDGGPWTTYAGETLAWDAEGAHRLRMRSTDGAGNVEPIRRQFVGLDFTPPAAPAFALDGTLGDGGWWVSDPVTVALQASDALSGVGEIRFRLDGGAWTPFEAPFEAAGDGLHVVDAQAFDRAGNGGPIASTEIRIDATRPDVVLVDPRPGGVYVGGERVADAQAGAALFVAGSDPVGTVLEAAAQAEDATSGVDRVLFRLNGTTMEVDPAAPYAWTWDARAYASGLYGLDAVAVDGAGNAATDSVRVVLASTTPEGLFMLLAQGPALWLGLLALPLLPRPRQPDPPRSRSPFDSPPGGPPT